MPRLLGVEIPAKKKVAYSLRYINGIGPTRADFLVKEGDYAAALTYLEKAAKAPARPGREVADKGRRAEIDALMATAKAKAG